MNFDGLYGEKKEIDPDAGGDFMNLNLIRALAQGAGAVTGEGTWQADLGNVASNWARNKAIQKAGAKQLQRRDEFDQMIQALAGKFTSSEDDPTKPNKITFKEGQYIIEGGSPITTPKGGSPVATPEATSEFADEDPRLESKTPLGGSDLRDFLRYSQDNWA